MITGCCNELASSAAASGALAPTSRPNDETWSDRSAIAGLISKLRITGYSTPGERAIISQTISDVSGSMVDPISYIVTSGTKPANKRMKLSEWAHVAEIIGGAAIIASLIFVGVQVRENTQVVRLTSDRAIDQQNLALNLSVAEHADLAQILVRGETDRDSLTDAERARFDNYCFSRFGGYENVVGNFGEGFVPESEMEVWAIHFDYRFNKPGYRQFWIEFRDGYFPIFRAWADERFGVTAD